MVEGKGSMLTDKGKHLKDSFSAHHNGICVTMGKALVRQIAELQMVAGEKVDSGKPQSACVQHHQMVTPVIRLCPVEASVHAVKTGHDVPRRDDRGLNHTPLHSCGREDKEDELCPVSCYAYHLEGLFLAGVPGVGSKHGLESMEAILRLGGEVLRYGWKQDVSAGQRVTSGEVEVGSVAPLPFGPRRVVTAFFVTELPGVHEDACGSVQRESKAP